jgi:mono/diheme cytochrome c family protein
MYKKLSIIAIGMFTMAGLFAQKTTAKKAAPKGKEVYTQFCLSCHQPDGDGVPNLNPPLINTSYVLGDKKKLITWVLKGTTDKVEIDGQTYSNNMPPQNFLSDEQLSSVLTYIRSSFGNKASAITAADVKEVRATVK